LIKFIIKRIERKARRREQEKEENKKEQEQETQEIEDCLRMAVERGASEANNEYYMATKFFYDKYNRIIFSKFKTNEGKLGWLTRCYMDRSV
jgi:hypothetical protein